MSPSCKVLFLSWCYFCLDKNHKNEVEGNTFANYELRSGGGGWGVDIVFEVN